MSRRALDLILDHVRAEPSRTWSIIVTIYGDAIVPRGGSVWLGTLLAFFRGLDVADGVVRTAMSRLAADGWLTRTRVGRNSFYRLAEKGRETFARATEHIYRHRPPEWHGHFDMLLIETGAREGARAALEAAGFGMPLSGVFVAPAGTGVPEEAASALRLDVSGSAEEQRALAARAWPLEQTAEAYRRFIDTFEPLAAELQAGAALTDLEAVVARVLLIHDYRRIVLRDPILPSAILPEDWPGLAARAVCADIYGRLVEASERWLDENAVGEDGAPLPGHPKITIRFKA
ncbi:phenylacetic acid degradation operon negative regulatory protein [Xanthobacter flavus]|uniref:Phenylacetic acid degradation operon negative regulatory protein n=1 Tax=Xanthobacter flavus TaxID=281 RepID=A0A9W6CMQ2_XANFL|nr:phenylacetic acid degradation operon negative regulatory protein PaaX [Xanthobacter flavus]MDR6336714.1 phenylacetic acid degradation operon negative regulatory protein [Xanthobacter flavus]GLI25243.1 phenylacetic acid degradation operon negative regulatory protein [Xanthobacter flavus]